MFESLASQPPDGLLAMIAAFSADPRPGKVDLGVGQYRDAHGVTPVMQAVKRAEQMLADTQQTKGYLGIEGDLGYVAHIQKLVFGATSAHADRLIGLQTPGGSGALRLGAELIGAARPAAQVWLGTPSWPNHKPIFASAGLKVREYRFVDLRAQRIEFEHVQDSLEQAAPGDVVLLHGCCHNPTGQDLSLDQWSTLAEILRALRLVPFIDLAYHGLGDGLDGDAAPTRLIMDAVDEALVAYSCDKNFGLYRERVGTLHVMARDRANALLAASNAASLARVNWSMPPDHGAAIVHIILDDPELTDLWRTELDQMRRRIQHNRICLSKLDAALAFIEGQRGLFSNFDLRADQALALRANHGIYIASSGRVNVAGMQPGDAPAIVAALRTEGCLPEPVLR